MMKLRWRDGIDADGTRWGRPATASAPKASTGDGSSVDDETEGEVGTETREKVERPPLFQVLLHNDDYTTMEFVVMVLETIYHRRPDEAVQIMLNVHQRGIGVAGIYSHEIAETKIAQTIALARQHEFPLLCSLEPEP